MVRPMGRVNAPAICHGSSRRESPTKAPKRKGGQQGGQDYGHDQEGKVGAGERACSAHVSAPSAAGSSLQRRGQLPTRNTVAGQGRCLRSLGRPRSGAEGRWMWATDPRACCAAPLATGGSPTSWAGWPAPEGSHPDVAHGASRGGRDGTPRRSPRRGRTNPDARWGTGTAPRRLCGHTSAARAL